MWVCCSSAPRGGAEPLISLPPRRLEAVRWVPPTRWAPRRRLRSRSTTCSLEEAGAGGVGACSVREGDAQRARGSARGGGRGGRASAEGLPSLASCPSPTAAVADAAVVSLWVCVETPSGKKRLPQTGGLRSGGSVILAGGPTLACARKTPKQVDRKRGPLEKARPSRDSGPQTRRG